MSKGKKGSHKTKKRNNARSKTSPGEGERRAVRGLTNQYDRSALLVYKALMDDELNWIGVADRRAGIADDLVLGLVGSVVGHQFKSSQFAKPFRVRSLLTGSDHLLQNLAHSWTELRRDFPREQVQIRFITDDFPTTTDKLTHDTKGGAPHSAAFLLEFKLYGSARTLGAWKGTRWKNLIQHLQRASKLTKNEFEQFIKSLTITTSGDPGKLSLNTIPLAERPLLDSIANLLPRLVSSKKSQDRWTRSELLQSLNLPMSLGQRRVHDFPGIDTLVQHNEKTESELSYAIGSTQQGYYALVGPPGCGKSTLLQTAVRDQADQIVIRYLAFMPGEAQGIGRAEAIDFLMDVGAQLHRSGLPGKRSLSADPTALRLDFQALLTEAGRRFADKHIRTTIVIDGLDHIQREEKPSRSFLTELPLPQALPKGVLLVLGSQSLDLQDIPPSVRDQASTFGRHIVVSPLSHDAIAKIATAAALPADVAPDALYSITQGHPLVTRYLIQALKSAQDRASREAILKGDFKYDGDIQQVYDSAWRRVENDESSCSVLRYVACAEAPLDPDLMVHAVPAAAIEKAYQSIHHLLAVDRNGRWRVFHNSFRLYVIGKRGLRFGKPDNGTLQGIYTALADLTPKASSSDPQRWMELRYRARAEQLDAVTLLATPARFREQFFQGRPLKEILIDLRLAFAATQLAPDSVHTIALVLSRHELSQRLNALTLFDALPRSLLEIGDIDGALSLLEEDNHLVASFTAVDSLIAENRSDEASALFDRLETIVARSEHEGIRFTIGRDVVAAWACRVNRFRKTGEILATIDRITANSDLGRFSPKEANNIRTSLRYRVASAVIATAEHGPVLNVMKEFKVPRRFADDLRLESAESAFVDGRVEQANAESHDLFKHGVPAFSFSSSTSDAALLAFNLHQLDRCRLLFKAITSPSLATNPVGTDDSHFRAATRDVHRYSFLSGALGISWKPASRPQSALLAALQAHIVKFGMIIGEFRAGRKLTHDIPSAIRNLLSFLQQRPVGNEEYSEAYRIRAASRLLARALVGAASVLGLDEFNSVKRQIDAATSDPSSYLHSWLSFRREIAMRIFERDNSVADATRRLDGIAADSAIADTPGEMVEQIADIVADFYRIGCSARAMQLLQSMHLDTLGYAVPAKKDPQYSWWAEIFSRACAANPVKTRDRATFLLTLLVGLSETEGRGAARRISGTVIEKAGDVSPGFALAVSQVLRDASLIDWNDSTSELLLAACRQDRRMTPASAQAWASLVLPYLAKPRWGKSEGEDVIEELVALCPLSELSSLSDLLRLALERDCDISIRYGLLESLLQALVKRALPNQALTAAIDRWRIEVPAERAETGTNDPTLSEIEEKLSKGEGDRLLHYSISRALASSPFDEIHRLITTYPELLVSAEVRLVAIERATKEGRVDDARSLLSSYRPDEDADATWDAWTGGAKKRFYEIKLKLGDDRVRAEALASLTNDLTHGRGIVSALLVDLVDVVDLVEAKPDWERIWSVVSGYLAQFREFRLSRISFTEEEAPLSPPELVARCYEDAVSLQVYEINQDARTGAGLSLALPEGFSVFRALLSRLLSGAEPAKAEAVGLLHFAWSDPKVRAEFAATVEKLTECPDIAISGVARYLSTLNGTVVAHKPGRLPTFYKLHFDEDGTEDGFVKPASIDSETGSMMLDEPLGWTWAFEDVVRTIATASGLSPMHIRMRAHQIITDMGGLKAFGKEAHKSLLAQLERLFLRMTYMPPRVVGPIRALRKVASELSMADNLDPRALKFLIYKIGYPAVGLPPLLASARPQQISRRGVDEDRYSGDSAKEFLKDVTNDVMPLQIGDEYVLAEASTFCSAFYSRQFYASRASIPLSEADDIDSLDTLLWSLPRAVEGLDLSLSYRERSPHFVARLCLSEISQAPSFIPIVCPYLARDLKWSHRSDDRFILVDDNGRFVARTIWWRDGRPKDMMDESFFGEGSALLVSSEGARQIRNRLGDIAITVRGWRSISDRHERESARDSAAATYRF